MVEKEKEIKKEDMIQKEELKIKKFFSHKANIWMTVSVVLAIILVAVLIMNNGVSKSTAGQKIIDFAKAQGIDATLIKVESQDSLYKVTISIDGQEGAVYITKDGKYFTQSAVSLASTKASSDSSSGTAAEVPKSNKPVVEAFIFSYCPYGLQFEKALVPVYNLLKNKADINVVAIGAMHGEFEKVESFRQLCVQKLYGKDKLIAYLEKFDINTDIGNCNGDAVCLKPLLNQIYSLIGIDSVKVDSCMTADAEKLYNVDMARAAELGVSGSPTFVINGVQVSVGRNPEAIKQAICDAFTTAPSECSQTLSSDAATAGFGGGTGTSTGASC